MTRLLAFSEKEHYENEVFSGDSIGELAAGVVMSSAQNKKSRATKEFMRDKLELAQGILEGLSMAALE